MKVNPHLFWKDVVVVVFLDQRLPLPLLGSTPRAVLVHPQRVFRHIRIVALRPIDLEGRPRRGLHFVHAARWRCHHNVGHSKARGRLADVLTEIEIHSRPCAQRGGGGGDTMDSGADFDRGRITIVPDALRRANLRRRQCGGHVLDRGSNVFQLLIDFFRALRERPRGGDARRICRRRKVV